LVPLVDDFGEVGRKLDTKDVDILDAIPFHRHIKVRRGKQSKDQGESNKPLGVALRIVSVESEAAGDDGTLGE